MPAAPLQEAKFGDSDQMQPGDWVMAIGNPFNLEPYRHGGRRLGPWPPRRRAAEPSAEHDPDRRCDQPWELRRTVAEHPRRGHRHEHRDLHRPAVGEHRHRVCDPDQLRFGRSCRNCGRAASSVASSASRYGRIRSPRRDAQAFGLPNTNGAVLATVARGQAGRQCRAPAGDVITEFNGKPVGDSDALVAMVVGTQTGNHRPADDLPLPRPATQVLEHHDRRARPRQPSRAQSARPDAATEPTSTGFGMTVEPSRPTSPGSCGLPAGKGGAARQRRQPQPARRITPASRQATSFWRSTAHR